ncbi:hypothetical protein FZ103_00685 [Streptomonospora sp. PA3]|uniref:hypothetical protein n=1 Tax=Streptomonospora sp. PA3 TaxID=2607326 RepID=UPI0012DD1B8B|nr:hypothetical protein [Streptomonospora sp. PA3]MUL39708.1 hypothetical protein [Streptomonospora sp. PA3]
MATPADVQQEFQRTAERINTRRDLSQQGKEVLTAREYVKARDMLAEAKQTFLDDLKTQRRIAERQLFGSLTSTDPTSAISRRDAQDRAARVEDATEARELLRRAERNGDEHLAQAIAARAVEFPLDVEWSAIVDEYVSTRPKAAEALARLRELPDPNDVAYGFRVEMQFAVVPTGALASKRPDQVDSLAATDLGDE